MHAAALCVLLLAATVLGAPVFALASATVAAVFSFALWRKYRRDLALVNLQPPPHRERLDLLVAGDARAALLAPLVLATFVLATSAPLPEVASYVRNAMAVVAFVSVVVFGSSLCDWYVILPRVTGMLGMRPCREDGRFKTFPGTWREVTRWWYIHRIVAAFFLVYGLALALGLLAAGLMGAASPWVDLSLTVVLGTFGAYRKALLPAVKEAAHPRLIVGQTVCSRFGERRYVYDVAMEGVQHVSAEKFEQWAEQMPSDRTPKFEARPERIALAAVDEMGDAPRYSGCDRRCAGISWYCIENDDCFKVK
jgi:hypothetical protein